MRDPDRIGRVVDELEELWRLFPDYRFGQLMMNLCRPTDGSPGFLDPWEWEEDEWLERIRLYRERYAPR